ncbi:MAG: hypothetical protein E7342_00185 [Clostridiales bacterium]|nr:hypothetical protein [Clostridiales bacterium]
MKLKEIIKSTAVLLSREDVISFIEKGYSENSDITKKDLLTFTWSANFVINELSSYAPIERWERRVVTNEKIEFDTLNNSLLSVKEILDLDGRKVYYKTFSDYVKIKNGTYDFFYYCLPSNISLEDEIIYTEKEMPNRIICYGIAREICIIEGRFDEANEWQKKFEESLLKSVKPKRLKNVTIKERAFY